MKKVLFFFVLAFFCLKNFAQLSPGANPAAAYIEGARVVIDILHLFKKGQRSGEAPKPNFKGSYCNFCLFNSDSTQKIKVTLKPVNQPADQTHTMVIKPKDQECSLQLMCGVYNCEVETMEGKIISWGDIFINEKEISITK